MTRTVIVGDGPAGLSAALLLAKNGHDTLVHGGDETLVHYAELHNYLGAPDVAGPQFQRTARGQAEEAGARLLDTEVTSIEVADDGRFRVHTAHDSTDADYVILAGGRAAATLAAGLGATVHDGAVATDSDNATSVDRLYAAGHVVRPERSQAIISAGDGAKAALDILSREAGRDVHDWDSPSDSPSD